MKKLTLIHAACLLVCGASLSTAHAQSASPVATDTPEIIVTASRSEQRVQDAMPSSTLITRADIDRAQTTDLPTLLRQVGGVEIGQTGGAGTQASAFIRGANSNHTLVLVDGVPLNNLNFGTAAIEHIPLANIERIEIVRGNVASLYGTAAIGGVIQIFTREAGKSEHLSVNVQKGSRNFSAISATGAVKLISATRLSATVEKVSEDGINAINQDKIPLTNPDLDGYKRLAYSFGVQQSIGKEHQIGLTVRNAKGRTQFDSNFGSAAASKQADESFFESQATVASGRFKLTPDLLLKVSMTDSNEKYNNDVGAFPSRVTSKTEQKVAGLDWAVNAANLLSIGVDQQIQKIESGTTYSNVSRNLDGVRLGYQLSAGAHQLQLNARQDKYSDFGSASTHYMGYAYRLDSAWRVNVAKSTGFNAPTFNDLYYPFGSGNINLRPERVNSYELGLQYVQQRQEARVVWFQNRYRDLIVNNAFFQRENIDMASNAGFELSTKAQWGNTGVNAGLTLQDPRNLTSNTSLLRRAQTLGFLNIQHDVGVWQLGTNIKHTGSRLDSGSKTLAAYSLIDFTVAYRLDSSTKITARLENAANQPYETAYAYNQPGRGVFVGLNWQLK